MFIKIGLRKNLIYPGLFILFLFLRKAAKSILEIFVLNSEKKIKVSFLMLVVIYIVQLVFGLFKLLCFKKSDKSKKEEKVGGLVLIQNNNKDLEKPDGDFKIFILIFFSAYFENIGAITRRYLTQDLREDRYDEYHAKFRSIEICFASIICLLSFNIKIFKHQALSLVIIIICLIIVLIIDIFKEEEKNNIIKNIGNVMYSSFCRVYLDTIEKYLFDYDFIDIFEIMAYEGIINCGLISLFYISDKPRQEIRQLFKLDRFDIILSFVIIFIYSIFTWFKNIYRRFTIKYYYPTTRALAESVLDPVLIFYDFWSGNYKDLFSFIVTISCTIIMLICSCIYNEIFILYCFGLEYDTHYEIDHRSKFHELPSIHGRITDDFDENENDN